MPVPKILITAGLMAANMALTMTRKIEGPRLDDVKVTGADHGTPLHMAWGLRRLQVPIFWAEELREVKRRRKTKGGKFNEYTYFGTWACALAGHQISKVRRVWFDTHLVLDLSGAGPVTPFDFGDMLDLKQIVDAVVRDSPIDPNGYVNDHFAMYPGSETQEPDPRMQATVEAEFGEGSCPAYRGTAYIVFKDIPLEKIGNRIPQVSVEIASGDGYPYTTTDLEIEQAYRLTNATFSADYAMFMWVPGADFCIWDVAAQTPMYYGTVDRDLALGSRLGLKPDGDFLAVSSGLTSLLNITPTGTSSVIYTFSQNQEEVRYILDGNGMPHWMTIPYSVITTFYMDDAEYDMADLTGNVWAPYEYVRDDEGCIWAVGREPGSGPTVAHFFRVVTIFGATGSGYFTVTGLPAQVSAFGKCTALFHDGHFVLCWKLAGLYRIDKTGTVVASRTGLTMDVYNTEKQFANYMPGAPTLWLNSIEYNLTDLTTIRTIDLGDWKPGEDADGILYNPVNHSLYCFPQFEQVLTERFLDRVGDGGVTLGSICEDVAEWCGIADYDFTALDQTVPGWSATRGQASNMLEPLLDAFDSDIRPHDFTIQGVKRSGTSGGTLLTEKFTGDPRYTVKVRQSADLPRAILYDFADVDAEQQPNTVRADRPLDATGARGEQKIDLTTLALDADTARQLANRHHRRIWNERKEFTLALTAQELKLEPADVRTLDLDGQQEIARCVKLTIRADDVIDTEWKWDHSSLAALDGTTGATFDGREEQVILVPLLSKGFVLDIPLLHDSHEEASPVAYFAASSWAAGGWPGAVFYEEVGGEYTEEGPSITSNARATWGYATEALPDGLVSVWDRGNSVNVKLQVGSLTGTTEAIIDQSPTTNLALLGDELINFTTATLEGDGSYTLSGLKRARRGTEWATGTHAVRDVFLLLDTADPEVLALSDVGTNLSYKAITQGRSESGAFPIDLAPYSGASKKPLSPVHLKAVRDVASGDWAFTWVRRTRVGGDWTSGRTIPVSEDSEEYELEIVSGSTVIRTVTGLSSATWTYSAANQVTDFGTEQLTVSWRVYQVSAQVDRGWVSSQTDTGGDDGTPVYIGGKTDTTPGVTGSWETSLTDLSGGAGPAVAAGDIVILAYATAATDDEAVDLVSSGWTKITELYENDIYDANLAVFWKVMGSTPDTSVTMAGTGGVIDSGAVAIQVWRNIDATTPLDVTSTTATGTNTAQADPPSITPTTSGAVIIAVGSGAGLFSAVYTSALDNFLTAKQEDNHEVMIGMGSHEWTSGAYNPAAFGGGDTAATSSWAAVTLALRPA